MSRLEQFREQASQKPKSVLAIAFLTGFLVGALGYGQVTVQQTTPAECDALTGHDAEPYPDMSPYYDHELGVCVVPEPIEPAPNETQAGNTTTNQTQ